MEKKLKNKTIPLPHISFLVLKWIQVQQVFKEFVIMLSYDEQQKKIDNEIFTTQYNELKRYL